MNLLDVVTGKSSAVSRQLFWRYKSSTQSALRDGDWKYLKIKNNEYLFNLAEDERERANLSRREAARFTAMQAASGRPGTQPCCPIRKAVSPTATPALTATDMPPYFRPCIRPSRPLTMPASAQPGLSRDDSTVKTLRP